MSEYSPVKDSFAPSMYTEDSSTSSAKAFTSAWTGSQYLEKVAPSMLERPSLGHAIRVGELFDERTNQFLDVQLYEEEEIKKKTVTVPINHTDLSLSRSNCIKDKCDILDIDPTLSLDILTGLVKVKGSASYVTDSESHSGSRSWAMALKVQTEKHQLLFAEGKLGYNALGTVKDNYLTNGPATHFVSTIVYGGNVIISMKERSTEVIEHEKLTRELSLELDNLKRAISLTADASIATKSKFEYLDNMFDFTVSEIQTSRL